MKACRKCGAEKPLSDFYPHKKMLDGHLNMCKECSKKATRAHRDANIERYREYDRSRSDSPERAALRKRVAKQRKADLAAKVIDAAAGREWRDRNREKRRAHTAVNNAVKSGALIAKPCERCGFALGVQAHHEDYSKPLDVTWLCKTCHGKRHREINAERRQRAA
jgi:hypothetical protein